MENVLLPKEPVRSGDQIKLRLTEEAGSEGIVPVCLPFSVVYEDEDLLVIDKPAGLPVHPSINHYENTLANGVMWRCQQTGEPFPFRCINRLDAGTTGLLIIAKNMFSAAVLYSAMRRGRLKEPIWRWHPVKFGNRGRWTFPLDEYRIL